MIKEILNQDFQSHKSSGKFSISGIGGCWRKKYMELKGLYKQKYDFKAIRTFAIGDAFHRMLVKELMEKGQAAGMHVAAAEVNIPVNHPDGTYLSGRADILLSISSTGELVICDCKSCSDWTLKKVKEGSVPQNYIDQVNMYLHFFGLKRGFLVFISKHKGEVTEFEVTYNAERARQVIEEVKNFFENFVDKNIEPPKCDAITSPYGCDCCDKAENNKITDYKDARSETGSSRFDTKPKLEIDEEDK